MVITSIIFLIMLMVSLSGCLYGVKSDSERLVGSWRTDNGLELVIFADETCRYIGSNGVWELIDDKIWITITYSNGQNIMSYSYEFSDNDKTLTFIDAGNRAIIFSKV